MEVLGPVKKSIEISRNHLVGGLKRIVTSKYTYNTAITAVAISGVGGGYFLLGKATQDFHRLFPPGVHEGSRNNIIQSLDTARQELLVKPASNDVVKTKTGEVEIVRRDPIYPQADDANQRLFDAIKELDRYYPSITQRLQGVRETLPNINGIKTLAGQSVDDETFAVQRQNIETAIVEVSELVNLPEVNVLKHINRRRWFYTGFIGPVFIGTLISYLTLRKLRNNYAR